MKKWRPSKAADVEPFSFDYLTKHSRRTDNVCESSQKCYRICDRTRMDLWICEIVVFIITDRKQRKNKLI